MQRYNIFCNLSIEKANKMIVFALLLTQINLLCANTDYFCAFLHIFTVCVHIYSPYRGTMPIIHPDCLSLIYYYEYVRARPQATVNM